MGSSSQKRFDIGRVLSAPVFPEDADKTRIAFRLNIISLLCLVLTTIYTILWLMQYPDLIHRVSYSSAMVFLCLAVFILIRTGYVELAGHIFPGGFWLISTSIIATAGGTLAPFFSVYILIVMTAVIFSGWRSAVMYGILSLITGLAMVYGANRGWIDAPFATPMSAFLSQVVIMIFVIANAYIRGAFHIFGN